MISNPWRIVTPLALVSLIACGTPYHPLSLTPTPTVGQDKIVTFRARASVVRLHAVAFTADSVSGIPLGQPAGCSSSRLGFDLADISQPRVSGSGISTPAVITALVALGVVAYYLVTHKRCNPVCPPG